MALGEKRQRWRVALLTLVLLWVQPVSAMGGQVYVRSDGPGITVFSPPALKATANEIVRIYPRLKLDLTERIGWPFKRHSTVWLLDDEQLFQRMIGRPHFSAFAQPEAGAMVIDSTKMHLRPSTLETTLTHELCHLLLHEHLSTSQLPRWLDEGVAQWASDGISELLSNDGGGALRRAVLSENIPSFERINQCFSLDQPSVHLAYEASRSIVDYMVSHYGVSGLRRLLDALRGGETLEAAFPKALGVSVENIEREWYDSFGKTDIWLMIATAHIYEILFFIAAMMTLLAFARQIVKNRRWADSYESDEPETSECRDGNCDRENDGNDYE